MTRNSPHRQLFLSPAGAYLTLLAMALLAPPVAEGGCSHLVTSRTDPGRLSSLLDPLLHDLAGESSGIPAPAHAGPRPCSGTLCSGQPAVPVIPAGLFDAELDSWACLATAPDLALSGESPLSAIPDEFQPTRYAVDIFHPPRLLQLA